MSRYYDGDYDEDFPNQSAFWRHNADRAMNGKRGRKVLAELREALRNLPEKRLISSAVCTVNGQKRIEDRRAAAASRYGGEPPSWYTDELEEIVAQQGEGVCAVGAYVWWQKVKQGADPVVAFDELPALTSEDGGLEDTAALAKREAGVTYSLAWDLAFMNDETFHRVTPEQRYERFMQWLDEKLGDREPVNA